jgi:anti-sigma factor RsiW
VSVTTCDEYRELASAFVDEQLEGEELLRLEAHLVVCPECQAFEGELRRFRELLRAAEAFRPLRRPLPGFAALVASRAAELPRAQVFPFSEGRAQRRVSRGPWIGMAAAAAAAALFFAWSWQRLLPDDSAVQRLAERTAAPAQTAAAAPEEGNIDIWMREHTMLARAGTLLGPAEEIEFASFHAGAVPER